MKLNIIITTLSATVLAGCSTVQSDVITTKDHEDSAQRLHQNIERGQEPINGPITCYEAQARAVHYNGDALQIRIAQQLEEIKTGVVSKDLLPELAASSSFSNRSNVLASRSVNAETGDESLAPSFSTERKSRTATFELRYNMLDFGAKYYGAKQQANKASNTAEQTRQATQDIVRNTAIACEKAILAQKLRPEINSVLAKFEAKVNSISKDKEYKRGNPRYTRLFKRYKQNIRRVKSIQVELEDSLIALAALLNVRSTDIVLVGGINSIDYGSVKKSLDDLERFALTNRPEMRQLRLVAKNIHYEAKKNMLQLFPSLDFGIGTNYDSNPFLENSSYNSVILNLSYNLLSPLKIPGILNQNKALKAQAEIKEQALAISVITQVRLAVSEYQAARNEMIEVKDLHDAVRRDYIAQKDSKAISAADEDDLYLEEFVHRIESHVALIEYNDIFKRMVLSLGTNLAPTYNPNNSIAGFSNQLKSHQMKFLATTN